MVKTIALLAMLAAHPGRPTEPHITKQSTDMVMHPDASPTWERHIWIRNPLRVPVWVYVECEEHLTVNPVGVPDRRTSEITLPDVHPNEQCLLHHWYRQDGRQPKPWSP